MIKYLISLTLLTLSLFGALTLDGNAQKQNAVLESFDIDPSFLYDKALVETMESYRNTYKNRHFFKTMDEAYLYIPLIKQHLNTSELPSEFLFLAMAESNFVAKAYSHKRAAGLWQFMPSTAQHYGLHIDDYVDERRDLVKSTKAAMHYLSDLHERFGKWYLAAMAYNCGEGRVQRAIERAGSDKLSVLIDDKKHYLPAETRLYIRKIVALAIMGSDEHYLINEEYEFLLNRADAFSIVAIDVPSGERLSRLAEILKLSRKELKKYNPHLNFDFVPPYGKTYTIYIPYVKLSEFKQNYKPEPLQNIYLLYTVQAGDSLGKIGKKYRISYKKIMDFNEMHSTKLSLKQRLIIPIDKPSLGSDSRYIVRQGDTLISIAKAFEITVQKLKAMNKIDGSMIKVGDRLHVFN
jgi:membrane-bound lytic murein transglycosylase D